MDYRKLCVELFGTDDEATLGKILQISEEERSQRWSETKNIRR